MEPSSHDFMCTTLYKSDRTSGIRFQYTQCQYSMPMNRDRFPVSIVTPISQRVTARSLSRRSTQLRNDIDINERAQ